MPTIHVHGASGYEYTFVTARKPRTRDAGSLRSMYEDLTTRMMLCLRHTLAQTNDVRTVDDLQGHAFHGNQHTGGISGPHQPKSVHVANVQHALVNTKTIKSAKMAVHALLSSGHPFSKDELAIAVGMDPQGKTINDYLTNLKNPKFAGPQGALKIEKNKDGHFFVALPNGQPAPPPDTKMDWSTMNEIDIPAAMAWTPAAKVWTGHDPQYQAAVKEGLELSGLAPDEVQKAMKGMGYAPASPAPPPAAPPPVPQPHMPEPVHGDPVKMDSDVAQMLGVPPGTMSKAQADKHYTSHMDAAFDLLKGEIDDTGMTKANDAVLSYKKEKAYAMAAWGQAVHGTTFNPKPQQVFKADLALAMSLAYGGQLSKEVALAEWKKNTDAEKKGNFPPKTEKELALESIQKAAAAYKGPTSKPTMAVPSTTPPVVDMGHASYVPPIDYHELRPAKHKDIDTADIMKRKFSRGILSLKKELKEISASSAQANKHTVEEKMRARLKDKPNFQALVKRMGYPLSGPASLESRLIQAWAGSSGDHNDISVAIQLAVRDAFAIPDEHIEKKALDSLDAHGGNEDKVVVSGLSKMTGAFDKNPLQPHEIGTARAALQEFVQAQYHETQELLKGMGRDHVFVVRGMKSKVNHNYETPMSAKLQPASSFSADYETSRGGFTGGGYGTMFMCRVPRQQVLSTYLSGFGCTGEHELVVLAHDKLKAWTLPAHSHIATSATGAQDYLQHKLKEANPSLKIDKTMTKEEEEY